MFFKKKPRAEAPIIHATDDDFEEIIAAGYAIVSPPVVLMPREDMAVQGREMMFRDRDGVRQQPARNNFSGSFGAGPDRSMGLAEECLPGPSAAHGHAGGEVSVLDFFPEKRIQETTVSGRERVREGANLSGWAGRGRSNLLRAKAGRDRHAAEEEDKRPSEEKSGSIRSLVCPVGATERHRAPLHS